MLGLITGVVQLEQVWILSSTKWSNKICVLTFCKADTRVHVPLLEHQLKLKLGNLLIARELCQLMYFVALMKIKYTSVRSVNAF